MPLPSSSWLLALSLLLVPKLCLAQNDSGMNSGGLAPPPAVEPAEQPVAPTATERELTRADREDAGRGLEFVWLNAEAGFQHVGLHTFHADNLVDGNVVPSTQSGLLVGAGAGVRLIFFTAGARFRFGNFSAWKMWTLDAEFGMRIPLGAWEPYFTLAGGYASVGSFSSSSLLDTKDLHLQGFDLRPAAGIDYYVAKSLSFGANASGDFLFLSRDKLSPSATPPTDPQAIAAAEVYSQDGSGVGAGFTITAVAGLHF